MPYIFDLSNAELPDDGSELPPPKPAAFMYLTPPEFGGPPEPVPIRYPGLKRQSQRQDGRLSFKVRVMRTFGIVPDEPVAAPGRDAWARKLGGLVAQLRDAGIERLYVRYDGGNDEGFGWVDSVERGNGERVPLENFVSEHADQQGLDDKAKAELNDLIAHELGSDLAAQLLGGGFGTGEYVMYGALIADLSTLTLVEDRQAEPVTENIQIDLT